MSDHKITYGLSLNRNNPADAPLMDWLDAMPRGGVAANIRAGLRMQQDIEAGVCEVVSADTIDTLNNTIAERDAEIANLRAQLVARPQPVPVAPPIDGRILTFMERQTLALEKIASTGLVVAQGTAQATADPITYAWSTCEECGATFEAAVSDTAQDEDEGNAALETMCAACKDAQANDPLVKAMARIEFDFGGN